MSWEDQGRDERGRFGDGKGSEKPKDTSADGGIFGLGGFSQRIQAVAYGTIGVLPHVLRARAPAQYDAGNLARLTEAMTAWFGGARLSDAAFADRFFGRAADDPVAEKLHRAALDVGLATSHAELREAAEKVADAMKTIGLDNWPRFLVTPGRNSRGRSRSRSRMPASMSSPSTRNSAPMHRSGRLTSKRQSPSSK